MAKINLQEGEIVEFKRQWTDRALEDLAAFANTQGGSLWIGVDDDGTVVGVETSDEEIQRIANVITSRLGLVPSIRVENHGGKSVIVIQVERAGNIVPCNGRYLRRVASTNRDFAREELARQMLRLSAESWDRLSSSWRLERLSQESIERFVHISQPRLPHADARQPERLLQNLGLLRDEYLTNAAVLLFAREPQQLFPTAQVKKRWGTGTTRIIRLCQEQGLPEPEFEDQGAGFWVTFRKDPYTPELLRKMGLNEREVAAVLYVKERSRITNREYQELAGVSKRTASRDLDELLQRGLLERVGETGKGTYYILKGSQTGQRGHKGAVKGSNTTKEDNHA